MSMGCNEVSLMDVIARHGGVLAIGKHAAEYGDPTCPLCVLEAHAACLVARGELDAITDDPKALGRPDYRSINDAWWSSREVATPHLVRLHMAYSGWPTWSEPQRLAVTTRVVVETIREVVSELPGLPDEVRDQCRAVRTLVEAREATGAAEAAADRVLVQVVDVWVRAAEEVGDARCRAENDGAANAPDEEAGHSGGGSAMLAEGDTRPQQGDAH